MDREQRARQHFSIEIDRFLRIVALTLDDSAGGDRLASHACMSRYHFQRTFQRMFGESPGALRRRLLIERAAHELQETARSVTEIAFDAGYQSLEGFSRRFRRAFQVSPGDYRRLAPLRYRVICSNGIHYDPSTRAPRRMNRQGEETVDLTDRLLQHDAWMTRKLLEHARTLTNEQLDCVMVGGSNTVPWELPEQTLRKALTRMIFFKEMWVAAVRGLQGPEEGDVSPDGMLKRLDRSFADFTDIVKEVRDQGKWDETFVDGICAPAETFTFGGMIAHVITYSACRRQAVLKIMEALGIGDLCHGDPLGWEMSNRRATS